MVDGDCACSGGSTISIEPTTPHHDTTPPNTTPSPLHHTTPLPTTSSYHEDFSGLESKSNHQTKHREDERKCGWELKVERELRVVTDYSGIETLGMSLDVLGRNYTLLSISDINAGCRRFVEENFKPKE